MKPTHRAWTDPRAALLTLGLLACKPSAPSEPPSTPSTPARAAAQDSSAPAQRYRPSLDESARRIAAALGVERRSLDDAGAPPAPTLPRRLEVGGVASVDVVAARVGDRWVAAAVEADRVTIGLEGAERIFQLREREGRPMNAFDLADTVGVLLYYPYPVYDGTRWSDTPVSAACVGMRDGATPQLVPKPQGGRDLLFSFHIPDGSPGAGTHVAHLRVTDSGLLIDQAPNPERR